MINKEICGNCNKKMAVWDYMPGYSGGGNSYSCDNCISSPDDEGCSCNYHYTESGDEPEGVEGKDWRWIQYNIWIKLDEQGRPYPCAEYWYSEEGWEVENE
jgi:hypothetical protein